MISHSNLATTQTLDIKKVERYVRDNTISINDRKNAMVTFIIKNGYFCVTVFISAKSIKYDKGYQHRPNTQ